MDDFVGRLSLSDDQPRCRGANIRAIQIGADAPP